MANETETTQTLGPTAEQEIDKFQGFATKDGEVQKDTAPPRPNGVPNTGKFTAKTGAAAAAKKADAAAEGDAEPGAEGDDKHASADRRIGQAVGRQRAAERRADRAEADLAATNTRLAAIEARLTAGPVKDNAPKAPDPKDYDGGEYDARYLADVAKFEARAAVAEARGEVRTEAKTAAQTADQTRAQAEFKEKRDDFFSTASETYDDFEDVVADPENPLSPVLGELAMDSDFGAQILYELAGDRKEALKVAKMTGAKQAAWFGRQEARLTPDDTGASEDDGGEAVEKPLPGPKPKVSKAPPVPDYNGRGNGQVPKVSGSTTDFAAFERAATAAQK